MNAFLADLARVCREHLLDEKWLLAPSRRIARQWLDALVLAGVNVVNVRLGAAPRRADDARAEAEEEKEEEAEEKENETPSYLPDEGHDTLVDFARFLAREELARRGVTLAWGPDLEVVAELAWRRLPPQEAGYFDAVSGTPGFAPALARTIQDLRLADAADKVDASAFAVPAKGAALRAASAAYAKVLDERKLVDKADILRIALARLAVPPSPFPPETFILVPPHLARHKLERDLIAALPEALAGDRVILLRGDEPAADGETPPRDYADIDLLRWVDSPRAAPPPRRDDAVQCYRAIGETNEVREALRRIRGAALPLDQVEIIYTAREPYRSTLYETLVRLYAEDAEVEPAPDRDAAALGVPATFAEGVPASYSRPGRALAGWVEWVTRGYPRGVLVRLLQDRLLLVDDVVKKAAGVAADDVPDAAALARLLRGAAVEPGRNGYVRYLDQLAAALERRLQSPPAGDEEEPGESPSVLARRLNTTRALRTLVAALLALTPAEGASVVAVLAAAKTFLERFARFPTPQFDAYCLRTLVERISTLLPWAKEGALAHWDAWAFLRELPGETRAAGAGPRPGRLHISPLGAGGHAGRPYTFILGLDDTRFPGGGRPEPLLLDDERQRLSDDLITAGAGLAFRREEFLRLLARLRGRVTLSYSCYDIGRDRELFPSPPLVAAYRILAGEPEGDLAGMRRWLGPPASFGPADPARALDESEWWLARLCAPERRGDVRAAVAAFYPHLRRGLKAEETRAGTDFTAYDGFVPAAGAAHAPDRPGAEPLSAHRLETIGACPRRYFYYYVLGLTPPPETKPDEDAWLDPPTLGTLLHGVFREFIGALGRPPDKTRDRETLGRILDAHIAKYRELYPPASAAVFDEQKADLYKVAAYFLVGEDKHGADHTPRYVEVALGLRPTASGSPLDCRDALSIRLPDGRVIRGRGKVDRLDERADGAWEIWDYKTGKLGKYGNKQPYNQGRVIQHAFYLELVRNRLSAAGSSIPPPARFGFFFPGLTEKGTRVVYDADRLADGLGVVALLCDVVAGGAFAATDSPGECDYCDYQPICGDEPAAVGEKLATCPSPALAPLKELRSGDKKAAD